MRGAIQEDERCPSAADRNDVAPRTLKKRRVSRAASGTERAEIQENCCQESLMRRVEAKSGYFTFSTARGNTFIICALNRGRSRCEGDGRGHRGADELLGTQVVQARPVSDMTLYILYMCIYLISFRFCSRSDGDHLNLGLSSESVIFCLSPTPRLCPLPSHLFFDSYLLPNFLFQR